MTSTKSAHRIILRYAHVTLAAKRKFLSQNETAEISIINY